METETAHFNVVETLGHFRKEIGEMSEMQVYAHVRTRTGCDMREAEDLLTKLGEKGSASVSFKDTLGTENRIDIQRM